MRSIVGVGMTPPKVLGAPKPWSSVMISSTLGAPFGGTTRGGHQGVDSEAFSLTTPPNFGSGGGSCCPVMVVVASGEPGVPDVCCAKAAGLHVNASPASEASKPSKNFVPASMSDSPFSRSHRLSAFMKCGACWRPTYAGMLRRNRRQWYCPLGHHAIGPRSNGPPCGWSVWHNSPC